ncbi:hypothetical protein KFK09_014060 [Dendrobium nobile]|uniref:Uncharacterized protein n=1 Tax=Dendrobium nobile TaxID=94219 RepID=A0A8T3BBH3_DENNO|nr:hypothetical protein KFK09_014060 [Dendrobium nobile]
MESKYRFLSHFAVLYVSPRLVLLTAKIGFSNCCNLKDMIQYHRCFSGKLGLAMFGNFLIYCMDNVNLFYFRFRILLFLIVKFFLYAKVNILVKRGADINNLSKV